MKKIVEITTEKSEWSGQIVLKFKGQELEDRSYSFTPDEFDRIFSWGFGWNLFIKECYRILEPNGHFYCFSSPRITPELVIRFSHVGFCHKNTIVWIKNNHGCGDLKGDWAPAYEDILFFTKRKPKHLNPPRRPNIIYASKISPKVNGHLTEKPLTVLEPLILASSNVGDTIFDPYAGTGSLGEAALRTGRGYILVEQNETYFNVAKARLEAIDARTP